MSTKKRTYRASVYKKQIAKLFENLWRRRIESVVRKKLVLSSQKRKSSDKQQIRKKIILTIIKYWKQRNYLSKWISDRGKKKTLPLNKKCAAKNFKASQARLKKLGKTPCLAVYVFEESGGACVYIGAANNIGSKLKAHFKKPKEKLWFEKSARLILYFADNTYALKELEDLVRLDRDPKSIRPKKMRGKSEAKVILEFFRKEIEHLTTDLA